MLRTALLLVITSSLTTTGFAQQKQVQIITSGADSEYWGKQTADFLSQDADIVESAIFISVDPTHLFETFVGIGGAVTDATATVYAGLSPEQQRAFLDAYFDTEQGLGYSIVRTTIHSCDFSPDSYTYVQEGDTTLSTFSIEHDLEHRIPLLHQIQETAGEDLKFYASPWSPPAYMKDNGSMLQGGKLKRRYYDLWAGYFIRFIQAYEAAGIPLWGLTIQNEPLAVQRWESCIWTAEEERDFLRDHLGPQLWEAGMDSMKVIFWDHNRDLIYHRAAVMLNDPKAAQYVWGVGFHWYETWAGGEPMYENLQRVAESFPDKKLIFTEGCVERFDSEELFNWAHAERYARALIGDLNEGTVAWTDWNLLLDERGGPNHVGNFCFAPVHAVGDSLVLTPSYYTLGHFSRYIRPGAQRMAGASNRSGLKNTSYLNADGSMVTIVLNDSEQAVDYVLLVGDQTATLQIPARSIQSLVY